MSDLSELAERLHFVRDQRRKLADTERELERQIADLMSGDVVNLADNIVLERRRGTKRTRWQSDELFNRLRTISRFSLETGEEVDRDTHLEQFTRALKECLPLTPSLSWRAGALREWGTDPDEYATCEPGRVSVKVEVKSDG